MSCRFAPTLEPQIPIPSDPPLLFRNKIFLASLILRCVSAMTNCSIDSSRSTNIRSRRPGSSLSFRIKICRGYFLAGRKVLRTIMLVLRLQTRNRAWSQTKSLRLEQRHLGIPTPTPPLVTPNRQQQWHGSRNKYAAVQAIKGNTRQPASSRTTAVYSFFATKNMRWLSSLPVKAQQSKTMGYKRRYELGFIERCTLGDAASMTTEGMIEAQK